MGICIPDGREEMGSRQGWRGCRKIGQLILGLHFGDETYGSIRSITICEHGNRTRLPPPPALGSAWTSAAEARREKSIVILSATYCYKHSIMLRKKLKKVFIAWFWDRNKSPRNCLSKCRLVDILCQWICQFKLSVKIILTCKMLRTPLCDVPYYTISWYKYPIHFAAITRKPP